MRLKEVRPEISAFAEEALIHRRAVGHHFHQLRSRSFGASITLLPTAGLPPRPRPPILTTSIAVEDACASNCDVLLLERVDEWRVIHQLHAFPAGENEGQVLLRIGI